MQALRPDRADRLSLQVLGLGLVALYALSAPRTVALEDDGELTLAAYFLGVAHPPGYPLHTLLGHLFSWLPLGSIAWRVHLLSGVLGAGAAMAVYLALRRLGAAPVRALLAAAALGLSEVFWSQSIVAEVYTLHLLLFGLMWWLSLRIHDGDARPGTVGALAAATGLALANHWPMAVLAGPALLPLVWRHWRALLRPAPLAIGAVTAVVPYLWLWLRSRMDPVISFYGPLESWRDLLFLVSRKGFAGVDHNPMSGLDDKLAFLQFLGSEALHQFTPGGAALALLGAAWLWRQSRHAVVLSLAWIVVGTSLLLVANLDFEYFAQSKAAFRVYPLQAWAAAAILLGCGLEALARWAESRPRRRWAVPVVSAALLLGITATSAPANWRPHDDWGAAYARAFLAEAPPDAVLIMKSDWASFTVGYLHYAERACPGCTLIDPKGLLFPTRLFDPLRTQPPERDARIAAYLASARRPVAYSEGAPPGNAVTDRWLLRLVAPGAEAHPIEISPAARAFYASHVAVDHPDDATIRTLQQDLRRRYLFLHALGPIEPARAGETCREFWGCLGFLEGMLAQPERYPAGVALDLWRRLAPALPADAHRVDRARVIELHGLVLARSGERQAAIAELQRAVSLAPEDSDDGRRALAVLGVTTEIAPLKP